MRLDYEKDVTGLHQAAARGNLQQVQQLLASGADMEARTHPTRYTPLLLASRFGHLPVVQLLVQAGADTEALTRHFNTALHLAADCSEDAATVRYLATQPGTDMLAENRHGSTALELAARKPSSSQGVLHVLLTELRDKCNTELFEDAVEDAIQRAVAKGCVMNATMLMQEVGPGFAPDFQEAREHDQEDSAYQATVGAWEEAWMASRDMRQLQRERRLLQQEQAELAAAKQAFANLIVQGAGVIRRALELQKQEPEQQQQQQQAPAARTLKTARHMDNSSRAKKHQLGRPKSAKLA
jgi:hypothetical protein